jgi:hypothetical protein
MLPTIGSSNFFSSLLSVRIPSRPFISIAVFLSIPHSCHLLLAQSRNYAPALRAVESTAPCRAGAKHDPRKPLSTAMSLHDRRIFNHGSHLEDNRQRADLEHWPVQSDIDPDPKSPLDPSHG